MVSFRLFRSLFLATTLLSTCLAQAENHATGSCVDRTTAFNSTGQVSFQFEAFPDQDWDFSLIMWDIRGRGPVPVHHNHVFESYISAPPRALTRGCWYSFGGINASASGPGANGCEGVLSGDCIDLLSEISYPTGLTGDDGEDIRCERFPDHDRIKDACPDEILTSNLVYEHFDFSDQTCNSSSPPWASVPDQYQTFSIGRVGSGPHTSDRNVDSFLWYDLHVQRPIPFVITIPVDVRNSETQVVCVAPDHVAEGSRKPEQDEPWESSGVGVCTPAAGQLAAFAAIAAAAAWY
ncbi:hypothetical protein DDE82_006533 [Stemphylium lycopersici]|nr:hypothetical protein DDE82_006533 [Stemphylium lycopersici]